MKLEELRKASTSELIAMMVEVMTSIDFRRYSSLEAQQLIIDDLRAEIDRRIPIPS